MKMRVFKKVLLGIEEMIALNEYEFNVFIGGVYTCSGKVRNMAGTAAQLLEAGYTEVVA